MIPRIIWIPVVCLLSVIAVIAGSGHSSGHAQAAWQVGGTPRLVFSTYLGGSTPFDPNSGALTFAQNAAADCGGNIYVTGGTQVSDLPVLNAWQPAPLAGSTMSAFVAKYSPSGRLLWCTYLGGNNQSLGLGIAAMPNGGAVVAGATSSNGSGPFPTMNGFQTTNNGESDYFVAVFDALGNLLYSTYLGGSGMEGGPGAVFVDNGSNGNNVAVDARGLVYVTGVTPSGGGGAIKFPVTPNALQSDMNGSTDAFLTIINPGKSGASSLIYSSFLGGNEGEQGHGVAVNARGKHITVGGYTRSTDFPTTPNAFRSQSAPVNYLSNGFVAQFRSSRPGSSSSHYTFRYSTYLGADTVDARDDTYGIALGPKGLIVATGRTQSAGFPMTQNGAPSIYNSAPYLLANKSGDEPYLVKIDPSLSGAASLVYSTYLGGGSPPGASEPSGSFGTAVGVDAKGRAFVGGETDAQGTQYVPSRYSEEAPSETPYTKNALITAAQGDYDAIFMRISHGGGHLEYSTFFGGSQSDRTYGLAVDPAGNVALTGLTFSSDFPVKNPAQTWPGNTNYQNAFVAKFSSR
ncbi:MAG: hypothetical protein WAW37_02940 [Syntrophobacteraceae bacterium]